MPSRDESLDDPGNFTLHPTPVRRADSRYFTGKGLNLKLARLIRHEAASARAPPGGQTGFMENPIPIATRLKKFQATGSGV